MFLGLFAFQSFSASISSLALGGLLSAFILVYDQSWGQRRMRGFPCLSLFFGFLIFSFSFHVFFPGLPGCPAGTSCAPEAWHRMVSYKRGTLILRWPHCISRACQQRPIPCKFGANAFQTSRLLTGRQFA